VSNFIISKTNFSLFKAITFLLCCFASTEKNKKQQKKKKNHNKNTKKKTKKTHFKNPKTIFLLFSSLLFSFRKNLTHSQHLNKRSRKVKMFSLIIVNFLFNCSAWSPIGRYWSSFEFWEINLLQNNVLRKHFHTLDPAAVPPPTVAN
jgi:Na+/melibiose symporter-like transporter